MFWSLSSFIVPQHPATPHPKKRSPSKFSLLHFNVPTIHQMIQIHHQHSLGVVQLSAPMSKYFSSGEQVYELEIKEVKE